MKNITQEKPQDPLHGRTLFSASLVKDEDIKDKDILDIGCGFGWFEVHAIQRGCKKIVGVEKSEKDLETAKKYIKNPRADFRIGSADNLLFEKNSFDTAVAWEVLEHIPKDSEDRMFSEVSRVLKDKGIFYLSIPHNSFRSKIFDPAWWLIGHRHYSKEKLYKLAEDNGFIIEKCLIAGRWWEIIGMLDLYIAKWIFRRKPFFEKFINCKQDQEYSENKRGFTNIFLKLRKK